MKNKLRVIQKACLLVALAVGIGCASKKENYVINVELEGKLAETDKYVFLLEGVASQPVDSVLINKDTPIAFKRAIQPAPKFYTLAIGSEKKQPMTSFFTKEEDVNIQLAKKAPQEGYNARWEATSITGNDKELLAMLDLKKGLEPIEKNKKALEIQWDELRATGGHLDSVRRAPLDSLFLDNSQQKRDYLINYVNNHQNMTALHLLYRDLRFAFTPDEYSNYLSGYNDEYKNTSLYKEIEEKVQIMKNIEIGATAPDFSMEDVDGNLVSLSSYRGKYVLLDFWASWCGPCRAENPYVLKAYNKYKDKGFDVLGVSYDYPGMRDNWIQAIKEDKLEWTQVSNLLGWRDPTVKLYNISGIPSPFLIDPEGKIVAKHYDIREEKLLELLAEIFDEDKR